MIERIPLNEGENLYIPDTSVILNSSLKELIETDKIETRSSILIHAAIVAEIEHLANIGLEKGFDGLKILNQIRNLCKKKEISFQYVGRRPSLSEIKRAYSGEIDALIRDYAWKENGTLITSDKIQCLGSEALGIKNIYMKIKKSDINKSLGIERFFDNETLSIHIKQDCNVYVKKGTPGSIEFEKFSDEITGVPLQILSSIILPKASLQKVGTKVILDFKYNLFNHTC